jgi:hypothetical protein
MLRGAIGLTGKTLKFPPFVHSELRSQIKEAGARRSGCELKVLKLPNAGKKCPAEPARIA